MNNRFPKSASAPSLFSSPRPKFKKKPILLEGFTAIPPLWPNCITLLSAAGANHFALFGGAVRDADYAIRNGKVYKPKDYDIRVWLKTENYEDNLEQFLLKLRRISQTPIDIVPSPGTNKVRYCFMYQGVELDISIRAKPVFVNGSSAEAIAKDRAYKSDIALSAIALDEFGKAWAMPEYLDDQENHTLTVYPSDNQAQIRIYTARMKEKFPDNEIVLMADPVIATPKLK